jgi:two-component system, LytTR family, response regulator
MARDTIDIRLNRNKVKILLEEIIYCKANSNYTEIYTTNERRFLIPKTLKWVEINSNINFIRIHHSYLINYHYLSIIKESISVLELKNGVRLPISRRQKISVLTNIKER